MKPLCIALTAALLGFSPVAQAQDAPVVVELFTSQGCSSCPPADAMLLELAKREDVIALALHVDYWDYIGWKDPFADPAHTARQRAYAVRNDRRSIYTPEMIVGGLTDVVGAKPMELSKAIAQHAEQPDPVTLDLHREGDTLHIRAQVAGKVDGPMAVHLLRYTPLKSSKIKRGENAGKTLDYANIVEGWKVIEEWDGTAPLSLTAPISGDKPAVVIIQQGKVGPILAAARLR